MTTYTVARSSAARFLAVALHICLSATLLLPGVWSNPWLRNNVVGAEILFLVWHFALLGGVAGRGKRLDPEPSLKEPHYFQAAFQFTVVLYWGLNWHPVYSHLSEVAIQLAFAYLFDMSLSWTLGRSWRVGLGPLPIVLSTNFFTWFRPEYFHFQLGTIALGYLAKIFITRKTAEGRLHVFNPSGFSLSVVALLLFAFGRFDITRADEVIPSLDIGFNIMEVIFLVSLVVNVWFPTVLITASAVVVIFILDSLVVAHWGLPLSTVPIDTQVLLGATLLITDPATSPRNKTGKMLFGCAYGLMTYFLLWWLPRVGQPPYFDKILPVPILNFFWPAFETAGLRLDAFFVAVPGYRFVSQSRALHLGLWTLFFVTVGAPALKNPRPQLLVTDFRGPADPEVAERTRQLLDLCSVRQDLCSPFSFLTEMEYRLRP